MVENAEPSTRRASYDPVGPTLFTKSECFVSVGPEPEIPRSTIRAQSPEIEGCKTLDVQSTTSGVSSIEDAASAVELKKGGLMFPCVAHGACVADGIDGVDA